MDQKEMKSKDMEEVSLNHKGWRRMKELRNENT